MPGIVDHYLAGTYRNGLKAQVVTYNRELAVAYTDKINEILAGYERAYQLSEAEEEEQKRRSLAPDALCFLVVTAKLLTGFDAPPRGCCIWTSRSRPTTCSRPSPSRTAPGSPPWCS